MFHQPYKKCDPASSVPWCWLKFSGRSLYCIAMVNLLIFCSLLALRSVAESRMLTLQRAKPDMFTVLPSEELRLVQSLRTSGGTPRQVQTSVLYRCICAILLCFLRILPARWGLALHPTIDKLNTLYIPKILYLHQDMHCWKVRLSLQVGLAGTEQGTVVDQSESRKDPLSKPRLAKSEG